MENKFRIVNKIALCYLLRSEYSTLYKFDIVSHRICLPLYRILVVQRVSLKRVEN